MAAGKEDNTVGESTPQDSKDKSKKGEVSDQAATEGALEIVLPKPPDGGWGWVVVLASLLANIIVDGITYTFGIFLPKFEEAFQQPKGTIALAGSLQVGTYLCVGPIVSALTNRFGCGRVTMVGSVIATVGFVLSVFAPTAHVLILTYGIIGGFGFGMMYLPAIVIVGLYFEKRRALATGIAVCGSGIGMFIMAPVSEILLQEFGHKGALLIVGGLVFNGLICGALFRPLPADKVQPETTDKANGLTDLTEEPASFIKPADVTEPLLKPITESPNDVKTPNDVETGNDATPMLLNLPGVTVLDGGKPVSKPRVQATNDFQFSSAPNVVLSSTRAGHIAGLAPRQRCRTMDAAERLRLRHVVQEVVPEAPKPATAPMGLSYIGLSDANLSRVRATTHTHVSRRDISMIGSSVLQIPDHSVQQPHLTSAHSVKSTLSRAENLLCGCLPESIRDTLLQMLDFSIMRNKAYVLILVGNIFAMLGFYVPFVFMPQKAMSMGIEESQAAFLLSIIGITNTVGRVMTGVLANLNKIDSLTINNIAMLVCGLATLLTPFCTSYVLLCVAAGVFGSCVAAYISLSSILLCDMLGVEQLTNAFGFLTLARGISSCAGSPLAGAIIDQTQDVDLAFYVGGALVIFGSLFHFLLHTPCIKHKPPPTFSRDIPLNDVDA